MHTRQYAFVSLENTPISLLFSNCTRVAIPHFSHWSPSTCEAAILLGWHGAWRQCDVAYLLFVLRVCEPIEKAVNNFLESLCVPTGCATRLTSWRNSGVGCRGLVGEGMLRGIWGWVVRCSTRVGDFLYRIKLKGRKRGASLWPFQERLCLGPPFTPPLASQKRAQVLLGRPCHEQLQLRT
jgi:hypothetical protein